MYYYEQVACLFETLQSEWNRYTLFFISLNHQDANSLQNIYNYITVSIETKNPNIIYIFIAQQKRSYNLVVWKKGLHLLFHFWIYVFICAQCKLLRNEYQREKSRWQCKQLMKSMLFRKGFIRINNIMGR